MRSLISVGYFGTLGILALGILGLGILGLWVFWAWVFWVWVFCPAPYIATSICRRYTEV